MNQPPLVVCFGEILWDFLPDAIHLGGASLNTAYHLHRRGVTAHLASAVGRDVLGDELVRRLENWGLSTAGLARHADLPTGYVRVALGPNGDARFDIVKNVAWDRIMPTEATLRAAARTDAFIFGSLAERFDFNRGVLEQLLSLLPPAALRVLDTNLRPPYDNLDLVRVLARKANAIKLNTEEAARLVGDDPASGREEAHARSVAAQTGCGLIILTGGARGAGLLRGDRWLWEPGRPVKVADTVGAGDAFLAALVAGLARGQTDDAEILARACRLGEWVASQHGATPAYADAQK